MTKFHSRVVRVTEMGKKVIVNFKEKVVMSESPESPQEIDEVKMFDDPETATLAIETFMESGNVL